jgi:hypothetical protein
MKNRRLAPASRLDRHDELTCLQSISISPTEIDRGVKLNWIPNRNSIKDKTQYSLCEHSISQNLDCENASHEPFLPLKMLSAISELSNSNL